MQDAKRLCVFKDVIHRNTDDQYHRKNGFTLPLHIAQLGALTVGILLCTAAFLGLLPCLPQPYYNVASVIISVVSAAVLVLFVLVVLSDPLDPSAQSVISARRNGKANDTAGAGPDAFCDICLSVDSSSKHCNICNKCVLRFDHHCIWVNNCIGDSNYHLFFSLVSSCTLLVSVIAVLGVVILLMDALSTIPRTSWEVFYGMLNLGVFYTVISVVTAICTILGGLLWQLFFLHCYLIHKNFTTYEYFTMQFSEDAEDDIPLWRRCIEKVVMNRKRVKKGKPLKLSKVGENKQIP